MTEDRELTELQDLARRGEALAAPPPAAAVRRMAVRRHRRRTALVAALALVVALAGGGALGQIDRLLRPTPDIAATPSVGPHPGPTPTDAVRSITELNLLRPGDVPSYGSAPVRIADPALGRPADQSSPCIPQGLGELGATAVLSRNFAYLEPQARGGVGAGGTPQAASAPPSVYTHALQFASVAEAKRAYERVLDWRYNCEQLLPDRGYTPLNPGAQFSWIPVSRGDRKVGEFAELVYRAGSDTTESGIFESLGLTRVRDRLAITILVTQGMDYNRAYDPNGDAENGLPAHEQYGLIQAAAERLGD